MTTVTNRRLALLLQSEIVLTCSFINLALYSVAPCSSFEEIVLGRTTVFCVLAACPIVMGRSGYDCIFKIIVSPFFNHLRAKTVSFRFVCWKPFVLEIFFSWLCGSSLGNSWFTCKRPSGTEHFSSVWDPIQLIEP